MADKTPGPGHAMFGLNEPAQSRRAGCRTQRPPGCVCAGAAPRASAFGRRQHDALAGRRAAGAFGD